MKHLLLLFCIIGFEAYAQDVNLGVPLAHTEQINEVEFHPEGNHILTTSKDNTSKIWDSESGKLIYNLPGYEPAKFSPDGDKIVTIPNGSVAKIWSFKNGLLIQNLERHTGKINSAHFSPDGTLLITASEDSTAIVWNVSTGQPIHLLKAHKKAVNYGKFSPNGKYFVTVSDDDTAILWITETGEMFHQLKGHKGSVSAADFNYNSTLVLTTSNDKSTKTWKVSSGKNLQTVTGKGWRMKHAEFSNKEDLILSYGANDKTVEVWHPITGKIRHQLKVRSDYNFLNIETAKFNADGSRIATICGDYLEIWSTETGQVIDRIEEEHQGTTLEFGDDGVFIALTTKESFSFEVYQSYAIKIWNLESKSAEVVQKTAWKATTRLPDRELKGHSFPILDGALSPEENVYIISGEDPSIRIISTNTGQVVNNLTGHNKKVLSLDISKDGNYIASGSFDSQLRIWDLKSGELVNKLSLENRPINVQFSPENKNIVSGSYTNEINAYTVPDLTYSHSFKTSKFYTDHEVAYCLSNQICATNSNNTAFILNSTNGKLIHKLTEHNNIITSKSFNSSGNQFMTTSYDKSAIIWNVIDGSKISHLKGHKGIIEHGQISSSGDLAVTGSRDNSAIIWDVNNGTILHTLQHNSPVYLTFFRQKDQQVITISNDNSIKVWSVQSGELISNLTNHNGKIISAQLTDDESKLHTSSIDGTYIIWDLDRGKLLLQHIIFDRDPNKWVHISEGGLFDASPEAMELMYWTKGLEVIEFAQLKDRYWVPGLWKKVMSGEALPSARGMNELKLQPEVKFGTINKENIPIHLTKREGGYGKVSIFINGKEVANDARGNELDSTKTEQTIHYSIKDHPYLVNGNNTITVNASSADGFVQGRGVDVHVTIKKEEKSAPQFFGVVIGVGDYANDNINLKYTVKDAEAISTSIQLGAENLFGKEKTHVYSITSDGDKLPTKDNIRAVFEEISSLAQSEDVIVLYLSGHGVTWGGDQGDFYFLTADATAANKEAYGDPSIRSARTISTNEWVDWLKTIPALKQVMIIDACGSGKAVDNLIAARDVEGSQIKAIDRMKDRTGMYIISGCTADAVSYEASQYGQGLLTYSILQAMKGAALKENKYVDVFTIMDYARESVPKLAKGIGGIQKPQLLIPKGGSFDIGILDTEDKAAIPLASPKLVFVRSNLNDAEEFEDILGLSELLDNELSLVSNKGIESTIVFFDAAKYPNACKISGGYTVDGNIISLSMKLRCGEELQKFELTAESKEELITKIVDLIN